MPDDYEAFKDLDDYSQKNTVQVRILEIKTEITETESRKKKIKIEPKWKEALEEYLILNSRVIFSTLMTGGGRKLCALKE